MLNQWIHASSWRADKTKSAVFIKQLPVTYKEHLNTGSQNAPQTCKEYPVQPKTRLRPHKPGIGVLIAKQVGWGWSTGQLCRCRVAQILRVIDCSFVSIRRARAVGIRKEVLWRCSHKETTAGWGHGVTRIACVLACVIRIISARAQSMKPAKWFANVCPDMPSHVCCTRLV